MKKSNFLRTVLSVVAAMALTTGVFGQAVANADYVQYDADRLAPTNIDYVTLRTGGSTTMGYYALPDPVYHPNYTAVGLWALTAGFVWDWTVVPVMATAKPGALNYVQVTYTAVNSYVVTSAEHAPLAMGGCADASPTVMNVNVIAPPAVTLVEADPAQACGDQLAMTLNMTFTEAVPVALAGYAFAVNQTIENITIANVVIGAAIINADTLDNPTGTKLNTGNGLTGAASPYGYSFDTRALRVLNGLRTRYTYTLVKASDAPAAAANGVISAISQKSDYVAEAGGADYLTYAFTDNQIVIVVNPAPATGPIYYVPNDFNY